MIGGNRVGERGYFVAPTVLTDVKPNMKVYQEEIFGPVVTALPFSDPAEVEPARQRHHLWPGRGDLDQDISKAHTLAQQLRAGTVWINCYNIFDAALPFGGYKQSGWGREMGHEVLNNYTETKSVCVRIK